MFWNKKSHAQPPVVDTALHDLREQMDDIDRIYKDPQNAGCEVEVSRWQDSESIGIISNYRNKMKQLSQFTKDRKEMREVIEGNGGYWGQYQENYKECQDRLELATLKLKIEQELYRKIYEKNRELESKLYVVERELEILKGEVK
jgi:hypothetical protein